MSIISLIMDTCKSVNAGRTTSPPSQRWYSPFQRPVREHPTGRSISCGVSDAPTSSLFSAFSPRNFLRRRVFSGAHRYRDPRTPSSTSWYYFNCVACLCCCFFWEGGPPPFGVCCPVHSGHRTQEWLDPLLQPQHSPWGMRGLPQRNRRNLHVWMNKRTEREAIAAEMEEKTLSPGAARKSFWTLVSSAAFGKEVVFFF